MTLLPMRTGSCMWSIRAWRAVQGFAWAASSKKRLLSHTRTLPGQRQTHPIIATPWRINLPTPTYKQLLRGSIVALMACSFSLAQAPNSNLGKPDVVIIASGMPATQQSMLKATARAFYVFWNTNDAQILNSVISPEFTDRDLPSGRPQGPTGPLFANTQFRKAVPDLHCEVTQQIIAGDRVVSNLRFTGHFTGKFVAIQGTGQKIDFVATDILRIDKGKITDNWHLEDNLKFMQQIGAIKE
jgi:predicted ester cyclase